MAASQVTAVFPYDLSSVWEVVTSVADYSWRSDLGRTEILSETQFVEYTKAGYATTFTITRSEPCRLWELDMENSHMKGHWTGVFTRRVDEAALTCIENVVPKKLWMGLFVKGYLKKQQRLFLEDLKRALEQYPHHS